MDGSGCRSCLARKGAVVLAVFLCLALTQGSWSRLEAQSPTPAPVPPGAGGATIGSVRVLNGNGLPRNGGQENQPPVWVTIDTKGASAVVTVGNATRLPLDFSGTVVISLVPGADASGVLVPIGSAVVRGNQVVWSGFSLSSGQIVPAIVTLSSNGSGASATAGMAAIQEVDIEAKSPQPADSVSERVAGGGPLISALATTPAGAAGANGGAVISSPQNGNTATPLSRSAARTLGGWLLALLGCVLVVLILTAGLVLWTGRRLERRMRTVTMPADERERFVTAAATLAETARVLQVTAADIGRDGRAGTATQSPVALRPSVLEAQNDGESGQRWLLERNDVTIGRNQRNDVVLHDPMVSDRHARLLRQPSGSYVLADEASTNGTLLNGDPVTKPVALREGDLLRFGSTTLVFHEPAPELA